jgi:hypothetical protein
MFAVAQPQMSRTVLEDVILTAQHAGVETLYMFIPKGTPKLMIFFKSLVYAGFKQVPPAHQLRISSASGLLLEMKITQTAEAFLNT